MASEARGREVSRRAFVQGAGVAGLGLMAGCGRLPWEAQQPARIFRVGILLPSRSPSSPEAEAFLQGLRDYGYVDGQNILTEYRLGEGRMDRLPELAAELVDIPVDIILTASNQSVRA